MTDLVRDYLGEDGIVGRRLPDYEVRPEQLELATAIERALRERRHLIAEAGTGVGKSFAYLLPTVLHWNVRLQLLQWNCCVEYSCSLLLAHCRWH